MSADQPTRVLFPLAAHLTGGSTFSALLLMRQLPARGFEPIVALHGDGPVTELATNAGVATYRSSTNDHEVT